MGLIATYYSTNYQRLALTVPGLAFHRTIEGRTAQAQELSRTIPFDLVRRPDPGPTPGVQSVDPEERLVPEMMRATTT